MKKYIAAIILTLGVLFLKSSGQQTNFTGIIKINREIGGTTVFSPWNPISHTLLAFIQNGVVVDTATWGSNGFMGIWERGLVSRANDIITAQQAWNSGQYRHSLGGGTYSDFITIFNRNAADPSHPNLGVVLNCKTNADFFWYEYAQATGSDWASAAIIDAMFTQQPFYYPEGDLNYFLRQSHINFILKGVSPEQRSSVLDSYYARELAQRALDEIAN